MAAGIGQYWLDGIDDVVESEWRWASTYGKIEPTFWYPGEPNQLTTEEVLPPSVNKSHVEFICGNDIIEYSTTYTYLGLVLSEFLDYNVTAEAVSASANRALGLVIAKCKIFGGVTHNVFSKLYESSVLPIVEYGAGRFWLDGIDDVTESDMRWASTYGKIEPIFWYPGQPSDSSANEDCMET
ncbi:uncharacterized protein LOC134716763 [Mytilus trossulus]|uniref:uncharacterized protein LOC134716763 n=1 Tax=Mytilus trossulus TaxID=6551 RepID=UPI0030042BD4